MCRWMAYTGSPMRIHRALFETEHSLVDQSLHSREGAETTNGDGFGVGWYSDGLEEPGVYHCIEPAWNDRNLRELSMHITSRLFIAHVRATSGTEVQESNCHPFRHGRWLFAHNGVLEGHLQTRRDLAMELDPDLFGEIRGTTDSEILFLLALTYGLEDDPIGALERAVGTIEAVAERHGIASPVQMTLAVSDGEQLIGARYATVGPPRTLYVSADVEAMRALHPEETHLADIPSDARAIVSEPLGSLPGAWLPVEPSTVVRAVDGQVEHHSFTPRRPVSSVSMA